MKNKILDINFDYKKVVIGSSINALVYSYLNNIPFVFVKLDCPHRFEYFSHEQDLSLFRMKNEVSTLKGPTSKKKVGLAKKILWEKLYFYLSLAGLNPIGDKAVSIKIEEKVVKVFTANARMAKIRFERLIVFDEEKVMGLPTPQNITKNFYKVYDWFDVRSGMKHEYDYISDTTDFVSEIIFYPTERVDGNQSLKDAVSVSYLTDSMLNSFEYSDINARFKTLKMMKDVGIRGARNGRDTLNRERYKYYAVKIENSIREVEKINKNTYISNSVMLFNNDTFDDIINKNPLIHSYVSRIFQ